MNKCALPSIEWRLQWKLDDLHPGYFNEMFCLPETHCGIQGQCVLIT